MNAIARRLVGIMRGVGVGGGGLLALLCWAAASLGFAPPARASEVDVALDDHGGTCRVRGAFVAPVTNAVAWEVLTDYDGISHFVRSVRASRLERRADGRLLLHQDAVGGVFLVRRHMKVVLAIREDPPREIAFRDVLGKDFRSYVGAWRLAADSTGTRVVYELEAEPRGAMERAFCRGVLRKTARDLLVEVWAEMIHRAAVRSRKGVESGGHGE